ncbi:MAG: hypothetical protein K6G89_06730 [Clostridia bacterium]|nr:hypothetical protein [Clostridia bacterium]
MTAKDIIRFIDTHWDDTVRTPDDVIHGNIRIPYNFTVPCAREGFTDFYYWDTYFTNAGLMLCGRIDQVRSNLDVMKFFVGLLGYVPNANHITDRSQPPLFTRGVYDLYKFTNDKAVILRYIDELIREHQFFVDKRTVYRGLCGWRTAMTEEELIAAAGICGRVGEPMPAKREDVVRLSRNLYSIAESGWDFNPRFNTPEGRFRSDEFVPVDLNCLLCDNEKKIAFMLREIGRDDDGAVFDGLAEERAALVREVLKDPETGLFLDNNYVNGGFSAIPSACSFYPYFSGISDDKEGALKLLSLLEYPCGLSTCANRPGDRFLQWDYPAMWPSNVFFAVEALESLGLTEDARRIAAKYIDNVTSVFEKTGSLWEKYDSVKGGVSVSSEYETPKMLGWTAGVYISLCDKYSF